MITEYRPVSWGVEPVSATKLQTMANNDQFLFESLPKMLYKYQGVTKDRGVKVLAMAAVVPALPTRHYNSTTVYFGDFFSVGCHPVVVFGQSSQPRKRYHCVANGIGSLHPDHRGVYVEIASDETSMNDLKITEPVIVPLVAIGF